MLLCKCFLPYFEAAYSHISTSWQGPRVVNKALLSVLCAANQKFSWPGGAKEREENYERLVFVARDRGLEMWLNEFNNKSEARQQAGLIVKKG